MSQVNDLQILMIAFIVDRSHHKEECIEDILCFIILQGKKGIKSCCLHLLA